MGNRKKLMGVLLGALGIVIALILILFFIMRRNENTALSKIEAFSKSGAETVTSGKSASLSEVSAMDVMCAPAGVAAMEDGTLLVTDTYNKRLWKVRERNSEVYAGGDTVTGLYGEPTGGYNDTDRLSSYFKRPWDVTEFLDGWAISDTENNVVRIVNSQEVKTLNGKTEEGASASSTVSTFDRPTGLATDKGGNLYVADTGNGAVRKISPQGVVTTEAEGLKEPMGLCWKDGVLYVAETGANRIVKVESGKTVAVAGNGEEGQADGPSSQATFAAPRDVAVGDDGAIYVADTLNSAIRRIQGDQVDTVMTRDIGQADFGLISPSGLLAQGEQLYICDNFARKLFVLEWK